MYFICPMTQKKNRIRQGFWWILIFSILSRLLAINVLFHATQKKNSYHRPNWSSTMNNNLNYFKYCTERGLAVISIAIRMRHRMNGQILLTTFITIFDSKCLDKNKRRRKKAINENPHKKTLNKQNAWNWEQAGMNAQVSKRGEAIAGSKKEQGEKESFNGRKRSKKMVRRQQKHLFLWGRFYEL